jgi:hypothetical protein
MESILFLSHDIMPDTIQYCIILPYCILFYFLFFCFFGFIPYAHTICRGECYDEEY